MFTDYKIILASKSPRRRQLLEGLDIPFEVVIHDVDEVFPEGLPMAEIPVYLAKLKAEPFAEELSHDALVILRPIPSSGLKGPCWANQMIMSMPLKC